jgi:hypothetical protein
MKVIMPCSTHQGKSIRLLPGVSFPTLSALLSSAAKPPKMPDPDTSPAIGQPLKFPDALLSSVPGPLTALRGLGFDEEGLLSALDGRPCAVDGLGFWNFSLELAATIRTIALLMDSP